jgi:beta-1,4-mannosyltransferase
MLSILLSYCPPVLLLALQYVGLAALSAFAVAFVVGRRSPAGGKRAVTVLVVGDLGRSPRMQYHALSLAGLPDLAEVSVVGNAGEPCCPEVEAEGRIVEYRLGKLWFMNKIPRGPLYVVCAPVKALLQITQLLWVLWLGVPKPSHILIQNPPGVPALFVVWLVCVLRGAQFVVDWHNLGYTIMSLTLGPAHFMVKLAMRFERAFGRRADSGFCVTKAMQAWLWDTWQVRATVLYDRPPPFFRRTPLDVRHDLFLRLQGEFPAPVDATPEGIKGLVADDATLFTYRDSRSGEIALRPDRPALLVSSTSWTPDEDFGILLDAIVEITDRIDKESEKGGKRGAFPRLCVVVTGKGPQRDEYVRRFNELKLADKGVYILTMWLEAADYPLLLGSADLGICLHTSSSALDLPMKVVDMFGCGLPVCAVEFKCLPELVRHGQNGLVFSDKSGLANQMHSLFKDFPADQSSLDRYGDRRTDVRVTGDGDLFDSGLLWSPLRF